LKVFPARCKRGLWWVLSGECLPDCTSTIACSHPLNTSNCHPRRPSLMARAEACSAALGIFRSVLQRTGGWRCCGAHGDVLPLPTLVPLAISLAILDRAPGPRAPGHLPSHPRSSPERPDFARDQVPCRVMDHAVSRARRNLITAAILTPIGCRPGCLNRLNLKSRGGRARPKHRAP